MATTSKKTDDETPKDQPKASARKADEKPYAEHAAGLADDTRALAESIREDLHKLTERFDKLGEVPTDVTDGPAVTVVCRFPAAIQEAHRVIQDLILTAADLAREAGR